MIQRQMLRLALLLVMLATASCAGLHDSIAPSAAGIGPYPAFSGRLLVMEPEHRWQVGIDWHADEPETGHLRLTHAASGMVIELAWQNRAMQMRDSQHPVYQSVTLAALRKEGIVVAPWTLAAILLDRMPPDFRHTADGQWEAHRDGALIRLRWDAGHRRLVLTDITHGRQATLLIGT